jgi:hypothetical protein
MAIQKFCNRGVFMEQSIKLVYVGGEPFWRLPEGAFREAEVRDGRLVEPSVRLKGQAVTFF